MIVNRHIPVRWGEVRSISQPKICWLHTWTSTAKAKVGKNIKVDAKRTPSYFRGSLSINHLKYFFWVFYYGCIYFYYINNFFLILVKFYLRLWEQMTLSCCKTLEQFVLKQLYLETILAVTTCGAEEFRRGPFSIRHDYIKDDREMRQRKTK